MDAYQATLDAARAAGLTIEPVVLQGYDFADHSDLFLLCAAEAMVEHAEMLAEDPKGFSAAFRARLALGKTKTAADLANAYRELASAADSVRAQLSGFTGLLMPATPAATRPFEAEPPVMTQFTALANVLGLPATVFPVGLDQRGRPLAAQALGWEDDTTLGLAKLLGRNLGAPPSFHG
jgi:aspartyl-tRNA(Asn)/glutamyl-tRNA(Gln) amidotransferase subunit A